MFTKGFIRHRRAERGASEGKGQFYITMVVIALTAFAIYKVLPVYWQSSNFLHDMEELTRTAAIRGENDEKIKKNYAKLLVDHQMPQETKLEIGRSPGTLVMKVEYTIPIEFPGYTYNWEEKKEYKEATNK